MKLWILLAGILVPGLFTLRAAGPSGAREPAPYERELFPALPPWVLILAAFLAMAPRFFRLVQLSVWPFTDEGYFSFFSLELLKRWSWKFFFALGQHPPAFNWAFTLFFKVFDPSLQTLWLFPAMLSALSVWVAWAGFKNYFPKSFILFGLVFLGFSFWPLYAGRICQPTSAILLAQVLAFSFLVGYLKAGQEERRGWAWACGAVTGLGFYVSIAWPVVALPILAAFLYFHWKAARGEGPLWRFLAACLVVSVPFFLESFLQKNGRYVDVLWALYPGMDVGQQCRDFFSHVQALFWGFNWRRLYGPVWGGLLNPVLGALVLTGAVELFRFWHRPFVKWTFLCVGLAFLPSALARGYDSFRIMAVLLPAFVFAASGLQALLSRVKPGKRIYLAALLILVSSSLDAYHLFNRFSHDWGTPGNAWNFGKEFELWKSYEILRKTDLEMGPGALLFDLRAHVDDVTLTVAAYEFDAAFNPRFSFKDAKWVAVLVDANYLPFLSRRFPEGRFYWLCPKPSYGWWALGVIPVRTSNQKVLEKWFDLNRALQPVTSEMINVDPGVTWKRIDGEIRQSMDKAAGDPFLESALWEKIFDNRATEQDAPACLEAARNCVLKGYPLSQMYNEQGVILVQMGRYQEAREAFEKAVKTDVLKLSPARENIKTLDAAGKR